MAQKIERQVIDVRSGKSATAKPSAAAVKAAAAAKAAAAQREPEVKKKKADAVQTHAVVTAQNRSKAVKYRIGAVVLWLVALGFEVLSIMLIKGFLYIPGNTLTYLIIGIVADLICVVCGSQLWKKSNRIDPASEKHPVRFFLWNNMGLIASLICFVPLVVFILKEKDLDPKTKKIATIIAVVAALAAGTASVDWNPVSAEDLAAAQNDAAQYAVNGEVWWTQFGKCYHFDEDCQSLRNSTTLYKGGIEEAFEANRSKPCSFCASEEAIAAYKDSEALGEILDADAIGGLLASGSDLLNAYNDDYAEFAD